MERFCSKRVCVDVLCRFALVALALIAGSTVAFAQLGNTMTTAMAATAAPQPEITRSIPASVVALRGQAVRWAV